MPTHPPRIPPAPLPACRPQVIRRLPRRIFVPLPDATQRERILQVRAGRCCGGGVGQGLGVGCEATCSQPGHPPSSLFRSNPPQVILKDEDLDPAFDFCEAASLADGYSGSDLKNLCIAAAYCPIREHLEREREAIKAADAAGASGAAAGAGAASARQPGGTTSASGGGSGEGRGGAGAGAASSAPPAALAAVAVAPARAPVRLRPISMADFKAALRQVTASTHSDTATMADLKRWNDQYGEGGSRQKEHLLYYT